jgi:hypothetical protein
MAFTEQGVAMLSSVLRSERAVEVNIAIIRTFVSHHPVRALARKTTQTPKIMMEDRGSRM